VQRVLRVCPNEAYAFSANAATYRTLRGLSEFRKGLVQVCPSARGTVDVSRTSASARCANLA
jgi:hypothetical protein